MSTRQKKLFWPIALLIMAAVAIAYVSVRARNMDAARAKAVIPPLALASPTPQGQTQKRDFKAMLARQPYALRVAMIMGNRFRKSEHAQSVFVGTLRSGNEEQRVRIMRKQMDSGEHVEIALGNGPANLTWSPQEGARSSGAGISDAERLLVERLVLDTPDAFILAQLRGASYQLISRNVLPAEAGGRDDYQGPVWDIVRVAAPTGGVTTGLQSSWRLYWINVSTGLIDRVVSGGEGAEVVASLSWVEQGGEKVPSRITWTQHGLLLMQLDFTGFNYSTESSQQ